MAGNLSNSSSQFINLIYSNTKLNNAITLEQRVLPLGYPTRKTKQKTNSKAKKAKLEENSKRKKKKGKKVGGRKREEERGEKGKGRVKKTKIKDIKE